jgi:hypothetical protein
VEDELGLLVIWMEQKRISLKKLELHFGRKI